MHNPRVQLCSARDRRRCQQGIPPAPEGGAGKKVDPRTTEEGGRAVDTHARPPVPLLFTRVPRCAAGPDVHGWRKSRESDARLTLRAAARSIAIAAFLERQPSLRDHLTADRARASWSLHPRGCFHQLSRTFDFSPILFTGRRRRAGIESKRSLTTRTTHRRSLTHSSE